MGQSTLVSEPGLIDGIVTDDSAGQRLRQLSRAVEQCQASVVITDRQGRIEYVNSKFTAVTGYASEEVIGQNPRILKSGYTSPEAYLQLWQTITAGREWHGEFHNRKKDGELYWESASISPVFDPAGSITHFVAVKEDITERKRSEESLGLFRTFIDQSADGMEILEPETGRFIDVNPIACARLGYTREEMLSMRLWEIATSDLDEASWPRQLEVIRKAGSITIEGRHRRKDGSTFPVEVSVRYVHNETDYLIAVVRDITERKRATEELRTTHAQLSEMLDHTPAVIYRLQIAGEKLIPLMASENITALLGFTVAETMSYEWWFGQLHPEDREQAVASVAETLAHETSRTEYRLRHKDGSYRWVEDTRRLIRDAKGEPAEFVGLWMDITERKRAEEALRGVASEETGRRKRKPLFELALIALLAALVFRIGDITDVFLPMFRYIAESPAGQVDTHADEVAGTLIFLCFAMLVFSHRRWRESKAEVVSQSHISKALRKLHDEMETQVRQRTAELDKRNKELQKEITERKRALEQIQEQAALLDKAQDAIMVCDLEDRIFFWNKAAERIYGWTREEAWAMPLSSLFSKDAAREVEANDALLKDGEWSGELQRTAKDGRKLTVEARWTLLRDGQGNPKSILSINTDITEKKAIEAQFLHAQRMESIGTLASGVAHDLNNILAPILMASTILREQVSPDHRELMRSIEDSAQRGADIVKQVLTFARGIEGERINLQLRHLVKDMVEIARETFPKSISIRNNVPGDLWTVVGDSTQFHQVLLNLCINARDAMPDGGVLTVAAENLVVDQDYSTMEPEAKPGNYIVLSVTDSGTGIPQKIIDKIFDPFFTTKEIGKGTGLGLSTVIGIVKAHGGFVKVHSELGKGSTFKIHLPASPDESADPKPIEEPAAPPGNGEWILIADDEHSIRKVTEEALTRNGYNVLAAADGIEAISLYATHRSKIAIVVTDVMMPHFDGIALISALKRMNSAVRIIASTGQGGESRIAELKHLGIKTILQKPFASQKLLAALHESIHG